MLLISMIRALVRRQFDADVEEFEGKVRLTTLAR